MLTPIRLVFALALVLIASLQGSRLLLTLYAATLGARPFDIGMLAAFFGFFPIFSAHVVGRLVDRVAARSLLMFGSGLMACAAVFAYFAHALWPLYVSSALLGVGLTFAIVTLQNLAGTLGGERNAAAYFSVFGMTVGVGMFAAPMLTGFAVEYLGFALAALALAAPVLPVTLLLWARGAILPSGNRAAKELGRMTDILGNAGARRVLVISALVDLGFELWVLYVPIYAVKIGLTASTIGVILASSAGASILVRIALPWLLARFGLRAVLSAALVIAAAGYAALPFFTHPLALAAICFLFGLGIGCGAPLTMMAMYGHAPAGRSGEALGVRFATNNIARVVGPLALGTVGSAFGLLPVFLASAALMTLGAVFHARGEAGSA